MADKCRQQERGGSDICGDRLGGASITTEDGGWPDDEVMIDDLIKSYQ